MRGRDGLRAPLVVLALAGGVPALAQDLEPRAYAPNPTGVNFLLLGYGHSSGSILFDAALPLTDVSASLNSMSLIYGRTFGLFGRSAGVTAAVASM